MPPETENTETTRETETPEVAEVSTDIASIIDDIDEESPEPNRAAIEGFRAIREVPITGEAQSAPDAGVGGPRDRFGSAFDPAMHHTNDDGTPKLFKGKLRRKRQSKVGIVSPQPVASSIGQRTPEQIQKARLAGRVMADSFVSCAQMIGGHEFAPMVGTHDGMKIDEKAELRNAFADYCEAKDIGDFPPGIALSIALLGYVGPRFAMPETQSRTKRFTNWLGAKWLTWKNRRATRKQSHTEIREENSERMATESHAARAAEAHEIRRGAVL